MQEPERIEYRVRRLPECLDQRRERRLGGARSLGVTAHAVDHREQNGVLARRHCDAILILLAMADQAHIRGLDLQ
jgi:hypothetical protein